MPPKILTLLLLCSCAHNSPTWESATEYCYHEYGRNADKLMNEGAGTHYVHAWESGAYSGCLFGIMEFPAEY